MTLEEAIRHEASLFDNAKRRGFKNPMERHKQMMKWLIELQERRKQEIKYMTDVEVAEAVGACTVQSAHSWLYVAKTLRELGYAVVERGTDG